MKEIKLESGKYTFVATEMDSHTYIIMNGWREFLGDKAINALFQYAADMRAEMMKLLIFEADVIHWGSNPVYAEMICAKKDEEYLRECLKHVDVPRIKETLSPDWVRRAKLVLGLKE